jgi:3-oxoacyl-[acyl-carrier protein] reductase
MSSLLELHLSAAREEAQTILRWRQFDAAWNTREHRKFGVEDFMELGLRGRVAIVAAASKGLGRAVAEELAREGAEIAICARTAADLAQAAARIQAAGGREVFWQAVNVGNGAEVTRFVADVEKRFGRVDICVTNAGGPPSKPFKATTSEDWKTWTDQLLMSVVNFAQEVLPRMERNNWGRFLTITSYSVKQPVEGLLLSNALRAGVTGLVRTLANEYAAHGITVNNVCPGYTRTDRLDDLAGMMAERTGASTEEIFAGWKKIIPAGRLGTPEEFASVVTFLASERASYINGVSLTIDGGTTRSLL